MRSLIRSTFWYDVTREMRRLSLEGVLKERFPKQAGAIQETLLTGGRVVFSPDDEEFYQEFEVDGVLHDPRTGKARGVRRL